MQWLALLVVVSIVASGALVGCTSVAPSHASGATIRNVQRSAPAAYTIAKQIRYSFTLHNKTNRALPTAEFWTYAPVPQTSHQWVESVSASQPYGVSTDALGNQILHFRFENFPPYGTKIVSVTADLKMASQPTSVNASDVNRFTQAEPHIEANHPRLSALSDDIRAPSGAATIKNAYDWAVANISAELYIPEDRGALYALTERKGDCTEFAYLLTALGRTERIPARPVGGYVFKDNAIVKAVEYHNWTEFFVDGRWQLVDAQKKKFMQEQVEYVAMRIISSGADTPLGDSHRFSYAGLGLEVTTN